MALPALIVLLNVAVIVNWNVVARVPPRTGHRYLAWVLLLLVGLPSVAQFAFPVVLEALQRDPQAIRHGQLWRLLTSMVVQDGGVIGTVSNLAILTMIALPAGRVWGLVRGLGWFIGLGLILNLMATWFNIAGAGNSGATIALAGVTVARCGLGDRGGRLLALLCLVSAVATLVFGDPHGIAMILGLAAGGTTRLAAQQRQRPMVEYHP